MIRDVSVVFTVTVPSSRTIVGNGDGSTLYLLPGHGQIIHVILFLKNFGRKGQMKISRTGKKKHLLLICYVIALLYLYCMYSQTIRNHNGLRQCYDHRRPCN